MRAGFRFFSPHDDVAAMRCDVTDPTTATMRIIANKQQTLAKSPLAV
jgi:hypothetical protein